MSEATSGAADPAYRFAHAGYEELSARRYSLADPVVFGHTFWFIDVHCHAAFEGK
jgi:hypothetical protein